MFLEFCVFAMLGGLVWGGRRASVLSDWEILQGGNRHERGVSIMAVYHTHISGLFIHLLVRSRRPHLSIFFLCTSKTSQRATVMVKLVERRLSSRPKPTSCRGNRASLGRVVAWHWAEHFGTTGKQSPLGFSFLSADPG